MRVSFNEVRNNKLKSYLLIFFFILIIGMLGGLIGLIYNNIYVGLIISIFAGLIYTLLVFNTGDKMILSMSGAKLVTKKEYPHLYHVIEGLTIAAGLKNTPKAYVIEDTALNAFATGKDPEHSSIAVTTGLLKKLNREELEGVIAHEMSHIKNYDIRFMMLTTILIGIVTLLSDFLLRSFLWGGMGRRDNENNNMTLVLVVVGLVLAILTPLIGQMIRLAISRKREFMADASAVTLTRYPKGLANALRKIKDDPDPLVDHANKATAHLFISVPFRKKQTIMNKLFSTHPPIDERIKILEEM